MGRDGGRQCFSRLVIKRAIQIGEHAECVLARCLRYQSCDVPVIPHQHDFFLVALHDVEDRAEVTSHLGY